MRVAQYINGAKEMVQWLLNRPYRRDDSQRLLLTPLRLGEILVRSGAITRSKLEEALRRQRFSRMKIGEVMLDSGDIKPGELRRGLRLQKLLISATLVATVVTAFFFVQLMADFNRATDLNPKHRAARSNPGVAYADTKQEKVFPDAPQGLIDHSSQVVLVRNLNYALVDVQILALEKRNGRWQKVFGPLDGVIARNGFAAPGEKREGDGRTPTGSFRLGPVFGYDSAFPTSMPYRQATANDLWVDDVQAADYNQWVERGKTEASSFELMRRDDVLYKLGIVVDYNTDPIIKGHGSAIFFHLWKGRGQPTSGCIALAEEDLGRIVRWLDPHATPLVVMGAKATLGGH